MSKDNSISIIIKKINQSAAEIIELKKMVQKLKSENDSLRKVTNDTNDDKVKALELENANLRKEINTLKDEQESKIEKAETEIVAPSEVESDQNLPTEKKKKKSKKKKKEKKKDKKKKKK